MKNNKYKILVVECDRTDMENIASAFSSEEFEVYRCPDPKEAIASAKKYNPHLILIELMMPHIDGIDICIEVRSDKQLSNSLIVFCTNRNDDYSQIAAFNAGADDYIIKPLKGRVLLSRIRALLNRCKWANIHHEENNSQGLIIDKNKYLVFKNGEKIILPRKEFELLSLLANSPKKIFTRDEIYELIWRKEFITKNRSVDVHIRRLRVKLGGQYIKTIKGLGYRSDV